MVRDKQYYLKRIARYSRLAEKYWSQGSDEIYRTNFAKYLRLNFRYSIARKKQALVCIAATKVLTDQELEELNLK